MKACKEEQKRKIYIIYMNDIRPHSSIHCKGTELTNIKVSMNVIECQRNKMTIAKESVWDKCCK